MSTPRYKKPKYVRALAVRTSAITGTVQDFPATREDERTAYTLVFVDHRGMRYALTPASHYDGHYDANLKDAWRVVGEPRATPRSVAQKARAAQGTLAPWEQQALDAAVYSVVAEYPTGAGPKWLHEDVFNNHGWTWPREDVERFGGLSPLAEKATYNPATQRSVVKSAVARLLKKGRLVHLWNKRAGEEYVAAG